MGDCTALGRVFTFRLDGDGVVTEDVEMSFGIGLLEELAALSGRRDGIEHAGIGDPRLSMVRDKLVSVCSDTNAWITHSNRHESLSFEPKSVVNLIAVAVSAWNRGISHPSKRRHNRNCWTITPLGERPRWSAPASLKAEMEMRKLKGELRSGKTAHTSVCSYERRRRPIK